MNVGQVSTVSSLTAGKGALSSARMSGEEARFSELLDRLRPDDGKSSLSSSQIARSGRLNGEYTTGFAGTFTSASDTDSLPRGAAANQSGSSGRDTRIDRTSELYEKAMELENYFVKQMLSSMRKTVMRSGESDFARDTYEDMLYDEYAAEMTKNAGFGLADQIYIQLA